MCHAGEESPSGQSQKSSSSLSSVEESELYYERESPEAAEPLAIGYDFSRSEDMQNGYIESTSTTEVRCTDDSVDSVNSVRPTKIAFESEGTLPSLSSPLLLCSTERDVFLLDPTNPQSPVIDKIEMVMARAALPTLAELRAFDRIAFLEWIPDLAIAVAGSLSGTVAIMRLCTDPSHERPRHTLQVIARIPEEVPIQPLYGVSIYRHPENASGMLTATLYLLYLDGQLIAYELSPS
ncbi:hypothetical protein GGH12_000144 [Coemansia sp. RSA 1822]|nr:hypothetical protein GGH12_000144 [Coemansia sp. RSA 1822]